MRFKVDFIFQQAQQQSAGWWAGILLVSPEGCLLDLDQITEGVPAFWMVVHQKIVHLGSKVQEENKTRS